MADESDMAYGMIAIDNYLVFLKLLKAINTTKKEIIPDYEEVIEVASNGLDQIKDAFAGREFLRKYFDFDISDKRIEEFENFLNGKRDKISGLDGEILKIDNLYTSLKYLN